MTVSLFSRLTKLKNFIDSIKYYGKDKYFMQKMKYYGKDKYFIFSVKYLMHLVKYLNKVGNFQTFRTVRVTLTVKNIQMRHF